MDKVVVVGGSLAGLSAAEALRDWGHEGEIVLVGEEQWMPYARPPLSKEVLAGGSDATLPLRDPADFEDLDIQWVPSNPAVALRRDENVLELHDGQRLSFDGLVVATGARAKNPFQLPIEGIHTVRTLDDCLRLRKELEAEPRVAVIGAGFIGAEVAAICRRRGLEVTLIEMLPAPLSRILGPTVGAELARLHNDHGVRVRCGAAVASIAGDQRVEAVVLASGELIEADLVVVGLGVSPNTEWLEGSGVTIQDGVACDGTCASSRSGVVAAGDVARWKHPVFGVDIRVEHWSNAMDQGVHAARRLLEGPSVGAFGQIPYFWSEQYDLTIRFWGHVGPGDELRIIGGDQTLLGGGIGLYASEGITVGAIALTEVDSFRACRDLIERRSHLDDAVAELAATVG